MVRGMEELEGKLGTPVQRTVRSDTTRARAGDLTMTIGREARY